VIFITISGHYEQGTEEYDGWPGRLGSPAVTFGTTMEPTTTYGCHHGAAPRLARALQNLPGLRF